MQMYLLEDWLGFFWKSGFYWIGQKRKKFNFKTLRYVTFKNFAGGSVIIQNSYFSSLTIENRNVLIVLAIFFLFQFFQRSPSLRHNIFCVYIVRDRNRLCRFMIKVNGQINRETLHKIQLHVIPLPPSRVKKVMGVTAIPRYALTSRRR